MEGFADRQIAQGLTYLVNAMASGDSGWFCSTEVPVKERIRSVEAVVPFFERLFKPRCTPHLSHLSEVDAGTLNGVCYMWWDVFPSLALAGDPNLPTLHNCALRTMKRILNLNSIACQESALHGLGALAAKIRRESYRDHRRLLRGLSGNRPQALGLCQICPVRMPALMPPPRLVSHPSTGQLTPRLH